MNKKLLNLEKHQQSVIADAANQRAQLVQIAGVWRAPLALADTGLEVLRFAKKHPICMMGVSTILLKVVKLNRVEKWLQRGLVAWQILSKLNSKI